MRTAAASPFEVFINTAKAGSETAAVSEAIGRLISYTLRLASPVEPVKRLYEVLRQLQGIGGGRALGFGPNRVRSLADGVGQVLEGYLEQREERMQDEPEELPPAAAAATVPSNTSRMHTPCLRSRCSYGSATCVPSAVRQRW
jgi:ribonucleoside-diphosphate reductase alpha chain